VVCLLLILSNKNHAIKKYHTVKFNKWDYLTDRHVIFADGCMVVAGQL
jgi:hypothetical protein